MAATEQGLFCQSCQKTVTDFSGMSDKEIVSFLNANRGNICGSFRKGQLNREISMSAGRHRRPLISIAAIVASLTIAIPAVQAQSNAQEIQAIPEISDSVPVPQLPVTITRITGIVNDIDGYPLVGASIRLDTLRIGTATDTSGRFELEIPAVYTEATIRLVISYIGFYTQEVFLSRKDTRHLTDEPTLCITMEPTVMGGIERAPLWYRIRYKIKRLFI